MNILEQTRIHAEFEARRVLFIQARFATGQYMCHCIDCETTFYGDKRAIRCFPCAEKLINEQFGA